MKKSILSVLSLFAIAFVSAKSLQAGVVKLPGGKIVRITADTPEIFHVQVSRNGKFKASILERYGIVRKSWRPVNVQTTRVGVLTCFKTSRAELIVNPGRETIEILNGTGHVILNWLSLRPRASGQKGLSAYRLHQQWLADYFRYNAQETQVRPEGKIIGQPGKPAKPEKYIERYLTRWGIPHFGIRIGLDKAEQLYGLGEASQKRIALRGYAYRNWVEYRGQHGFDAKYAKFEQTEGGIPFLMSTRGWAILMNTAWPTYFDLGAYHKNRAYVWGPYGRTDFYLMAGGNLRQNINLYTQISGRPILLPEWGYGLWFDGNIDLDQFAMLNDAYRFRRQHFPVDCYSLEPGWMSHFYDLSHGADWNLKSFYLPEWLRAAPPGLTFIGAMRRLGVRMGLWFCCNDDLTLQAARQVAILQGHPSTVPARPHGWYHHLRKFVREGIRAFKIDPDAIMNAHPGRKYFNGRRDLEMHNLTQSLLVQQMYQGAASTGFSASRIFTQYSGSYTGSQHYAGYTTDDCGASPGTLCWLLNLGLSGNTNTTADMEPTQGPATIQMGFFGGWTILQNWASFQQPWLLGPQLQSIFRYYDDLRHRLIPYIYSEAWNSTQTGVPIMRAMPIMYPHDPQCANLTREFMFGNAFLSVVFSRHAYLPAGDWFDFWSGKIYHGGKWVRLHIPADRGGGLFVRAGAIVPTGPVVPYVSRVPLSHFGLSIWPAGHSSFTLYQDDGVTDEYLHGQFATTRITCLASADHIRVTIGPRIGKYGQLYPVGSMTPAGSMRAEDWGSMPKTETFTLHIHTAMPDSVTFDGRPVVRGVDGWRYIRAGGEGATGVLEMTIPDKSPNRDALVINLLK